MPKLPKLLILLPCLFLGTTLSAKTLVCDSPEIRGQGKNMKITYPQYKSHQSQLFFIHNKSDQSILIDKENRRSGAQAGWSSELAADHWSVLRLSKKEFTIRCLRLEGKKYPRVDCRTFIKICQTIPNSLDKKDASFWVIENQTWEVVSKKFDLQ